MSSEAQVFRRVRLQVGSGYQRTILAAQTAYHLPEFLSRIDQGADYSDEGVLVKAGVQGGGASSLLGPHPQPSEPRRELHRYQNNF